VSTDGHDDEAGGEAVRPDTSAGQDDGDAATGDAVDTPAPRAVFRPSPLVVLVAFAFAFCATPFAFGAPLFWLIYLVPGRNETLRINGRARLVREAAFFDRMIVKGHRPQLALVVEIETIFFHCAKAFLRSALWQPETWNPGALPSARQILGTVTDNVNAAVSVPGETKH